MNPKDTTFNLFLPSRVYFFGSNKITQRNVGERFFASLRMTVWEERRMTVWEEIRMTVGYYNNRHSDLSGGRYIRGF